MTKQPAVYILSNQRNGTLYVGVTSNLAQRIWQHKNKQVSGFSSKYSLYLLVYYELHSEMIMAITREKQIKKWRRGWKLRIIEELNPEWLDLSDEVFKSV